jgi:hypothetical protein
MTGEKRDRWLQLCTLAADEQDPKKMSVLASEINRLLEEKQRRLGIEKGGEKEPLSVILPGTVEKIIRPLHPEIPEKAQISIQGADDLYREIRINNELQADDGQKAALKEGAQVDVTVQAEPEDTTRKTN